MDLVQVGQFMVPYLLNPTTYGYETCTIEHKVYNNMWKNCDNPMFCWSYEPLNSARFNGFGSAYQHGRHCVPWGRACENNFSSSYPMHCISGMEF